VLRVNWRSVNNKIIVLWKLVGNRNRDDFIGTESWIKEDIRNADVFGTNLTTFTRDGSAHGGGFFLSALKISPPLQRCG
jgi:hypothetical protein